MRSMKSSSKKNDPKEEQPSVKPVRIKKKSTVEKHGVNRPPKKSK